MVRRADAIVQSLWQTSIETPEDFEARAIENLFYIVVPDAETAHCHKVYDAMDQEGKDAVLVQWLFLFEQYGWQCPAAAVLALFNHGVVVAI